MNHTPGPWFVDADVIRGDDQAKGPVSIACILDIAWPYGRRASENAPANARLIAAAPDLLEVLKEIVQLWDHHCYAHGDGQPSALHVKACEAIAKATGETR